MEAKARMKEWKGGKAGKLVEDKEGKLISEVNLSR